MGNKSSDEPVDLPLFDFPMDGGDPVGSDPVGDEEAAAATSVDAVDLSAEGLAATGDAAEEDRPELEEAAEVGATGPVGLPRPEGTLPMDEGAALSFGTRLAAGLADLALQGTMIGATLVVVMLMGVPLGAASWPPLFLLVSVFSCLYWTVPLAFWGQTPGMTWMGLLSRTRDNQSLTFHQTFLRWLGAVVTTAFAGLPLLLTLGGGRSLGDRLSGSKTELVRKAPEGSGERSGEDAPVDQ